ncbi:MAG TPA: TetR/AcrR family transcriptional regulator, partial [Bacteroidetes bacterium]|nr:TetR/AcrR family transcriptional regulator [Bacteroidota bacterium]
MSPRTESQWEKIRSKSREKILNAATELFAENGFNATSISDIAKKAGISKGLVYNYFKSKEELLDDIVFSAFNEFDDFFETLSKNQNDPLESLYRVLEVTFKSLKEKPQFWKLITGLSFKQNIRERYAKQIAHRK